MKKLLTATLAIAMGATLVGAFAACKNGNDDAEIASKAIGMIRSTYGNKEGSETPSSYTVQGVSTVKGTACTVNWSVSSEYEGYANYVSVGEMDADTTLVPISIEKAMEVIDYTLTASITVGKAKETASFTRKIPATKAAEGEVEVSIDFTGATNRKVFTDDQQVWEENGIKLTNDKAGSITAITKGDSNYHVRLYQTSNVKIEYPGIKSLVFYSDNTYEYHAQLVTTLEASNLGTVTSDTEKATATLVLTSPADVVEFAATKQMRLTKIDIVASKDGISDEQRIAGVKETLDLDTKSYLATGTYDLPAEKNGTTITWAVTSDYVTVEGGKLKINSMPATETEVTLTATIACGTAQSDTKEIKIKLVPLAGVTNDGTLEHPYTAVEAHLVTALLEAGKTDTKDVYVKGYIIEPGEYSSYGNFGDVYIADEASVTDTNADNAFYIFRPTPDGTYTTETKGFEKGDLVIFKGKLQNYKKSETVLVHELTGATCVSRTEPDRTDAEKAQAALDALTVPATVTGNITLTSTVTGVTLAITNSTNTAVVALDGTVTRAATDTEVTLTVTATCNGETKTREVTVTVKAALQLTGEGTLANPYTVEDVKAIMTEVAAGGYYGGSTAPTLIHVKGYVVAPGTWSSKNSNYTGVYIVDEYAADKNSNSADALQVYGLQGGGDIVVDETHPVQKGELLTITGYLQNYNGVCQVTYKSGTNPTVVKTEGVSDVVKVETALGAVNAKLDDIADDGDVTLPVSTVDGVTLSWALADDNEATCATLADGVLTVTLPEAEQTVKLVVTATCGEVSENNTKAVTVVVKASDAPKEITLHTLDANTKGNNSAYATAEDVDVDGITWSVEGNATMQPWRFGGKGDVVRHLTGKTAITGTVTELTIKFGSNDTATVKKITLNVYASDGTTVSTQEVTYTKGGTVKIEADAEWTNCKYELVFDLSCSSSSNQFVSVQTITFTGIAATSTDDGADE